MNRLERWLLGRLGRVGNWADDRLYLCEVLPTIDPSDRRCHMNRLDRWLMGKIRRVGNWAGRLVMKDCVQRSVAHARAYGLTDADMRLLEQRVGECAARLRELAGTSDDGVMENVDGSA